MRWDKLPTIALILLILRPLETPANSFWVPYSSKYECVRNKTKSHFNCYGIWTMNPPILHFHLNMTKILTSSGLILKIILENVCYFLIIFSQIFLSRTNLLSSMIVNVNPDILSFTVYTFFFWCSLIYKRKKKYHVNFSHF